MRGITELNKERKKQRVKKCWEEGIEQGTLKIVKCIIKSETPNTFQGCEVTDFLVKQFLSMRKAT